MPRPPRVLHLCLMHLHLSPLLIVTDHSDYDYARIVRESQSVVDTRNATRGLQSPNIFRC